MSLRLSVRHLGRCLLLSLLAVGLSGCFEVQQKLTVHEDGEAELMLTVALSKGMVDLTESTGNDADCDTDFGFEDDLPPTLTKTSHTRTKDGDVLCDVIVTGPLIDMIPVMEDYTERKDKGNDFVLIQDLGDGKFALVGQYDFSDDSIDKELQESPKGLEKAIRGAVMASLEGAEISWEVMAPNVLETNGETREDGSVVWSFPLSDAVMTGNTYTFEVIFETTPQAKFF